MCVFELTNCQNSWCNDICTHLFGFIIRHSWCYIHLSNSTIFLNEWKTESGSNVIKSYEYSLKMKKNDFSPIINQNQSYQTFIVLNPMKINMQHWGCSFSILNVQNIRNYENTQLLQSYFLQAPITLSTPLNNSKS